MQLPNVFENFHSDKEEFSSWSERFSTYMEYYEIKDTDKQVKFFIASIGAEGYAVLKRLAAPKKPSELSLKENLASLEEYYDPKPLQEISRFKFRQRKQNDGENFAKFHAALKELSRNCKFEDRLDEELRSQIISGVRDARLQKQLLIMKDSTLAKVVELCTTCELAESSCTMMQGNSTIKMEHAINKISARSQRGGGEEVSVCIRCGRKNHKAPECRFINRTCNKCEKTGHLANVCGKSYEEIRKMALSKKPTADVNTVSTPYEFKVVDIG